jgi:hypothetical protein
MSIVQEALEVAAGAGDDNIGSMRCMERGDMRATVSPHRITGARTVIKFFLENLPEDMAVREILEELLL